MQRVASLALSFLLCCPALAAAQNLIPFADFDVSSDLTNGWGNLGAGKVWSSVDVDASPSSGSLLMIHDQAALTGILVWSTCVAVTGGQPYDFAAWYFMQILQPGTGFASVRVQWFDSCGGSFVGTEPSESSTVEGTWTEIGGRAVAPVGAAGARLQLVNGKSTGNPGDAREVYFDAAFLPEPGATATGLSAALALSLLRRRARRGAAEGRPLRERER